MDKRVREIVSNVSAELLDQGAKATVLTGSHARGRADEHSDIDLFAVGEGPAEWLRILEGQLVAVHWWTAEEIRRRLQQPQEALLAVLSWRDAVVVDDPQGIAAELKQEAEGWSWGKIEREADDWVAEQVVTWAEYVQKLVGALERGRPLDAAALRTQVALRLGEVLAVHRRITAASENGFWETVADAGGPRWRSTQERAFGAEGFSAREAAAGAAEMFALLAEDAGNLLDERQRGVVDRALERSADLRSELASATRP